ncbi:serine hydrolase domain-containing protein, partial [Deinococcus radiotolerans]|uniref:serine hydrolase domain-containing protein n=1 Tax=Deinococcus radiotolerans TaxID=1309407 RepID=UPI00166CFEEA
SSVLVPLFERVRFWKSSLEHYHEVLELLMEETAHQPFPELMQRQVLRPLGMTHSLFAQPLPEGLAGLAAQAHTSTGEPLAGRWHTYPELAAAGLWSTPSDLARWLLALARAANAREGALLSREVTRQMLTDHTPGLARWWSGHAYGLGLKLQGRGVSFSFGHTGINQGYRAVAVMYPRTGQGVVVMTNGENGEALAREIVRGVATTYDWPEDHTSRTVWSALAALALLSVICWHQLRKPRLKRGRRVEEME